MSNVLLEERRVDIVYSNSDSFRVWNVASSEKRMQSVPCVLLVCIRRRHAVLEVINDNVRLYNQGFLQETI